MIRIFCADFPRLHVAVHSIDNTGGKHNGNGQRQSPIAGAALDGVNAASFALMALVTWQLGRAAIVDVPTALLALGAGALLATRRVNAAWLILGGGIAGVALAALRG